MKSTLCTDPEDDDSADRHHHRAADALDEAREREGGQRIRRRAQQRAGQTKMPIAVRNTVRAPKRSASPAANRDEHAEPEHVARDRDFQRHRVAPEVARHFAGRAVTITLASTLSMNIAHATMRGATKALMASARMENRWTMLSLRSGDYGIDMEQPLRDPRYSAAHHTHGPNDMDPQDLQRLVTQTMPYGKFKGSAACRPLPWPLPRVVRARGLSRGVSSAACSRSCTRSITAQSASSLLDPLRGR